MDDRRRIESLLSARLLLDPKLAGDRVYYVGDASGRLSLHSMPVVGDAPSGAQLASSALLPAEVALRHPHNMRGSLYHVLPAMDRLLVMIDGDGDEHFRPTLVPSTGGAPVPVFPDRYLSHRFESSLCSSDHCLAVFAVEDVRSPIFETILVDLRSGHVTLVNRSEYGGKCLAASPDASTLILSEAQVVGDDVVYVWRNGTRALLLGTPPEERAPGVEHRLTGVRSAALAPGGALLVNALVADTFGVGFVAFDSPQRLDPVEITGTVHTGPGELVSIEHLAGERYRIVYNIDGCSWVYAGRYAPSERRILVDQTICGTGTLRDGVAGATHSDRATSRHVMSFSTATSPAQLFLVDDAGATQLTCEQLEGIPATHLSSGEDASFVSHDGLRVSARLYLPAGELGFQGRRPLVFYIHGGPRGQERPDFTWFSMPLIQSLTLRGLAVFVPNARGSSGYGLSYTKRVDGDWGGLDRLDHVAALETLRSDPRLDASRVGVMGRSYGGFTALNLACKHPSLWKAACSMCGVYDLITYEARMPEGWKPYYHAVVGHPERDRAELVDRSPVTHLRSLACPLLVIQGANDPRVPESEAAELVRSSRAQGKDVEYLMFPGEGHDILQRPNKIECYRRIVEFFARHLDCPADDVGNEVEQ